jgi:hypothetical protein
MYFEIEKTQVMAMIMTLSVTEGFVCNILNNKYVCKLEKYSKVLLGLLYFKNKDLILLNHPVYVKNAVTI